MERTVRDAVRAGAIVQRVRGMLAKHDPELVPLDINAVRLARNAPMPG